jgi:YVTN family beta-propeller protein
VPIVPAFPPQPVMISSGFDYVGVDAQRRRVYAAHSGSGTLLVVNADTSKVIGQIDVGLLHGVAIDPDNGHVYTGDSEIRQVIDVDTSSAMTAGPSVPVPGLLDATAYDPRFHHIYADEDDGTRLFVIDSRTMKLVKTVPLPGHKPEYLAIDPTSRKIYQNIANLSEFVVIDPITLTVIKTVKTPEVVSNHGLALDGVLGHIYIAGHNGVLSVYGLDGTHLSSVPFGHRIDQCSADPVRHNIACAGDGEITVFHDAGGSSGVSIAGRLKTDKGAHTVAFDTQTGYMWTVWAGKDGDFVQAFQLSK